MKRKSKILSLILSLVFVFAIGFTACGGGGTEDVSSSTPTASSSSKSGSKWGDDDDEGGNINIQFYGDGSDTETEVFTNLVNNYNSLNHTYNGKKIYVDYTKVNSVTEAIQNDISSSNCPTVFYVGDGNYKSYVESGYLADLTSFVENSEEIKVIKDEAGNIIGLDDMWDSIYDRYFYSTENHRAGANAVNGKFYGMPKDIGPTVMYYNEDQLNAAGIRVISVAEEDLDAFNNGEYFYRGFSPDDVQADSSRKKGRTFSKEHVSFYNGTGDVAINGTVGNYGYFVDDNGNKFINNQIAMSWDEIREVARILNEYKGKGTSSGYLGGYFTEWWFNYGWTVGGNCIEYVETSDSAYSGGFYDFTLVDDTKNFIVVDDCTDGIDVNGTHYSAGEIISYRDKLTNEADIAGSATNQIRSDRATYDSAIGYNGEANDALIAGGKLRVLPSQREAFTEFVRLSTKTSAVVDGINGYDISATPSSMGTDSAKANTFLQGNINFLVDGRWQVTSFRQSATFNWDVAPLPIYKTYSSEGFGLDRTVVNHGVTAGHSGSVALAISSFASAEKKAAGWDFIEYLAGSVGQIAQSAQGFAIPSQKSIATDTTNGYFLNQKDSSGYMAAPYNAQVFIDAAANEGEGDWAFLETGSKWIDDWANYLNSEVRNGTKTFDQFINSDDFVKTFSVIKSYTEI